MSGTPRMDEGQALSEYTAPFDAVAHVRWNESAHSPHRLYIVLR
jgi:hypothetical protein